MSKKIEAFWGNATADDVARVMKGETVEARFRDSETQPWGDCYTLTGWVNELRHQWRSAEAGGRWNFCQVYREPSYWANKPDPGPEWRLLGKFPDEELKPRDQAWDLWDDKQWAESDNANGGGHQVFGVWYRRRIEPVEPEPKHYVLRVGDSVETPNGHRVQVISRSETQRFYALTAGDKLTLPNGQTITITEKGFEVTQ
jgi:hypothetical protein